MAHWFGPRTRSSRKSLAFQDLVVIPRTVVTDNKSTLEELDLSHNKITDFRRLEELSNLKSLVLDNNSLTSYTKLPPVSSLELLWLNHNQIDNLPLFIDMLTNNYPRLQYLSMMDNPAAPSFFNGGTYEAYKDYRYYVMSRLGNLKCLDDEPITAQERLEAERIYSSNLRTTRRRSSTHKNTRNKTPHKNTPHD